MKNKPLTTLKDAILVEALERIGELECAIDTLPGKLDKSTEAFTNSAEALNNAGEAFRTHIDTYLIEQQSVLANQITLLAANAINSTAYQQKLIIVDAVKTALAAYEGNREDDTNNVVIMCVASVFATLILVAVGLFYFGLIGR